MTIDELNNLIETDAIAEFILTAEARQVKDLSAIADQITARENVRLVLIAGASSAGKTTTAKRLCTQLRVNEKNAVHLSTDDYFVGDARNPRDENGEFDYECVQCVDALRLEADINSLIAGRPTTLRGFDFVQHDGFDQSFQTKLPVGGIVVLEGIHALNPLLTGDIPDTCKFRLFVEPLNQLEIFAHTRLPAADGRLLRRLVRDNQFRKMSPLDTFSMWPKVLAGEKKWIDPFRPLADARFDSGLPYELAVLKRYVGGLLERVVLQRPEELKAKMLLDILKLIRSTDPTCVPGDSILRETIGGSLLTY